MAITADQIRQFDEDGSVILDGILTWQQAERARGALARIFRGEYIGDRRPAGFRKLVLRQNPVRRPSS
jgi:hypothetical protein